MLPPGHIHLQMLDPLTRHQTFRQHCLSSRILGYENFRFMRYGLTLCDCEPHLTSTEPRFWAPGGISPRPHSDSMKSWLVHEHGQ